MAENCQCLSGGFYLFGEIGVRSSVEMSSEETGRVFYLCIHSFKKGLVGT